MGNVIVSERDVHTTIGCEEVNAGEMRGNHPRDKECESREVMLSLTHPCSEQSE